MRRPAAATAAAAVILALLGPAAPAAAARVSGVTFPDAVEIAGRECRLNGVGARTRIVVKVYLGALYLATPTRDPAAAIAAEEPKRVVLHFLHRKVEAAKIREAFAEGFGKRPAAPSLQERIDRFLASVDEDGHSGEEVAFTYLPGRGTEIVVKGRVRGLVEGADFMQALWSIWLGERPADAGLKRGMLGL